MNALLIRPIAMGAIWLSLLFTFCFLGVHIAQLAKIGWKHLSAPSAEPNKPQNQPAAPDKKAPAPQTAQEPVYYIVERKKKRPKTNYGEPKPIRFP